MQCLQPDRPTVVPNVQRLYADPQFPVTHIIVSATVSHELPVILVHVGAGVRAHHRRCAVDGREPLPSGARQRSCRETDRKHEQQRAILADAVLVPVIRSVPLRSGMR